MENLNTGLLLMVVGMVTVFIILLIVIYLGKTLIILVNKFAPEEIQIKKSAAQPSIATVDDNVMSAIKNAVNIVTNGKGKVMKIEKI